MNVSDLWVKKTGLPWSEAKKLGLTNGTYEANIALHKDLVSGKVNKNTLDAKKNKSNDNRIYRIPIIGNLLKDRDRRLSMESINRKEKSVDTNYKYIPITTPAESTRVVQNEQYKNKIKSSVLSPNTINTPLPDDVIKVRKEKIKNEKWDNFNGKYYILSKENSTVYAFDKNHMLVDKSIVGRGKAVGDYSSLIRKSSLKGDLISTTPAGSSVFTKVIQDKNSKDMFNSNTYQFQYNNKNNKIPGLSYAFHGIPLSDFIKRNEILNDPKNLNKLMSAGCVNVPSDKLDNSPLRPNVGDSLFVTKEPERNSKLVQANIKAINKTRK